MNNYAAIPPFYYVNSWDYIQYHVLEPLVTIWLDEYEQTTPGSDVIETRASGFSYLFDVANDRLIAAWGFSEGKNTEPRPKDRMANHPMSEGPLYHRGHAIAHTLGGATDINLVPQLGSVNIGPFRVLERQAVATPGSLYFSYWIYPNPHDNKPIRVEQGLMKPGCPFDARSHSN